jgi:hypothetical protein
MTTIKLKRGLLSNFTSLTLEEGEPAFVKDTGKFYIGDGTSKVLINPDVSLADVGTPGTYTKVTTDFKGRVTSGATLTASDIPSLTLAKISDAGSAASKTVGTAAGNVPVLDGTGKLDVLVIPATAISDTFVVTDQASMLALAVQVGDVAVRTDLSKSFILRVAGASTLANWQELLTPTSPVQSVAGKTGAVTLTSSDVGLGNVTNESKATMFTNAALSGVPTAPTAATITDSTQIATTAYVKAQGYLTSTSGIDGGTF